MVADETWYKKMFSQSFTQQKVVEKTAMHIGFMNQLLCMDKIKIFISYPALSFHK